MSVETVETVTAETAATEVVERPSLTVAQLRSMRSNPAVRIADEFNPQDESLDKWVVLHSYREDGHGYAPSGADWDLGRFRFYEIAEDRSGNLTVGRHDDTWYDATRILEIFEGDYYSYFNHAKVLHSAGKFGSVYYDNLPREMRHLSSWPQTNTALFEVVSVDAAEKTAVVRLFAYPDAKDGDYTQLGEHTVPLSHIGRADLYSKEGFDARFGLAKDVIPMGTVYERIQTGEMWTVTGHSYSQVALKRTDNDGKISGRASNCSVADLNEANNYYIKLGDSWNDYLLSQPAGETAEMLKALSKITVAKALKHADANNYCSETAVALASAGHSLPELRVKGTITLNVDVSTKEYMVLRKLMGHTEGDADEAVANMFGNEEKGVKPNMNLYKRLANHSNGALPDIAAFGHDATFDLESELVWKAPRIRK